MGLLNRVIEMVPLLVSYYVVIVIANVMLNDLLFPAMDNAPSGYTGTATGKLIIFLAFYLILPLAFILYPFKKDDQGQALMS